MSLAKKYKLSSSEIRLLKKSKPQQSFSGNFFYLKYYKKDFLKFAALVLKKHYAKATARNYIRRVLYSCIRNYINEGKLKEGFYVFISRKGKQDTTYEEIFSDINKILSKVSKSG